MKIAATPPPPYYVVIFTALPGKDRTGYSTTAAEMLERVKAIPGFLGYESSNDGIEITLSYRKDLDAIQKWKMDEAHQQAQKKGKDVWYSHYKIRIAKVEKDYEFSSIADH